MYLCLRRSKCNNSFVTAEDRHLFSILVLNWKREWFTCSFFPESLKVRLMTFWSKQKTARMQRQHKMSLNRCNHKFFSEFSTSTTSCVTLKSNQVNPSKQLSGVLKRTPSQQKWTRQPSQAISCCCWLFTMRRVTVTTVSGWQWDDNSPTPLVLCFNEKCSTHKSSN